ncbi:MAG TPA: tyrosine-type recombinase/integrase [Clostridia bacterium]|nr:tyrosine-type recombinase/integrase [Clostridia bacterium]
MATITKRVLKSGVTYRIQVKLRDKGAGSVKVYTTTWHPPKGLTAKQTTRELMLYADKYENDLRMSTTSSDGQSASPDTTVEAFAAWWLERVKNENSASYYNNCKVSLKDAIERLGAYKLRELNPAVIQRFYDTVDKKKKTITTVIAKPALKEAMDTQRIGFNELRKKRGFNCSTLCAALAGQPISLEYAKRLSAALHMDVKALFLISQIKEPYAFETLNKIKRTLRAMLASAKKLRIVTDNYASADFISFPKRPAKEIDYMNDEDAKRFFTAANACDDIRLKTAALMLLFTGIRRGELCGLAWEDVDLTSGTITIVRSVSTVSGFGIIVKEPKTESSKRTLSISDKLIVVLTEYKAWYDNYQEMLGDRWKNSNRLFISEDGDGIYPGTIDNWVRKVCELAGLPPRTVHSLRHTNITMQIAAGVPLVTVSGRAGHARTSTTTDIYSHFLKSSDRVAAEALESLFDED